MDYPGYLKSIMYRDKLYKSWRQAYSISESSEIIKRNLSTYNNILKKLFVMLKICTLTNVYLNVKMT